MLYDASLFKIESLDAEYDAIRELWRFRAMVNTPEGIVEIRSTASNNLTKNSEVTKMLNRHIIIQAMIMVAERNIITPTAEPD